jgi:hypothetical protein
MTIIYVVTTGRRVVRCAVPRTPAKDDPDVPMPDTFAPLSERQNVFSVSQLNRKI